MILRQIIFEYHNNETSTKSWWKRENFPDELHVIPLTSRASPCMTHFQEVRNSMDQMATKSESNISLYPIPHKLTRQRPENGNLQHSNHFRPFNSASATNQLRFSSPQTLSPTHSRYRFSEVIPNVIFHHAESMQLEFLQGFLLKKSLAPPTKLTCGWHPNYHEYCW